VIEIRPFLNDDPPALVDIWRSQGHQRGLVQPMSVTMLEQMVLAKPYFDRHGLLVAVEDERPVGFAHAGFGPSENASEISTRIGTTCLLMVHPREDADQIRGKLLARCEEYLKERGTQMLYGGASRPFDAFYLGLYGGSAINGVLKSDTHLHELYRRQGYEKVEETIIFHGELAGFRPIVDRRQIQYRRSMLIELARDPRAESWWNACTLGGFDQVKFQLRRRDDHADLASATFWDMDAFSVCWGIRASGMVMLRTNEEARGQGLASYLMGEAMKQLCNQGIALIETQASTRNASAIRLLERLGFKEVDRAMVYRKE